METHEQRIVVLGAGYAGLGAAQRLARAAGRRGGSVTLVNLADRFVERPRLHQLAAGGDVADLPLAGMFGGGGTELVVGQVTALDLDADRLTVATPDGAVRDLDFDTLVYAAGSRVDTDVVPGVRDHAFVLNGPDDSGRIRRAATAVAAAGGTLVVCGGGLTGIEAATELAESHPGLRVELISAQDPAARFAPRAGRHLRRAFDRLGVTVRLGSITAVKSDGVQLADGTLVPADACLWAGGFTVPTLAARSGLAVDGAGRVVVDRGLRSVSHPSVYAIGDAAAVPGPWGDDLAFGCRVGSFMGPFVAKAITTEPRRRSFRYRYIHQCVSLGRNDAFVQFVGGRDERPLAGVLTGRAAVWYKESVLASAVWLFRHPGRGFTRPAVREVAHV